MQERKQKRIRWDRVGAVLGAVVVATCGIAAIVPGPSDIQGLSSEGKVTVTLPGNAEALAAPVSPASSPASRPAQEVERGAEQVGSAEGVDSPSPSPSMETRTAEVRPVPSGPMPRKGIPPCSCSKHTMKLARNPYTRHQKRARSLPGSFFVKNHAELNAGVKRGDLVSIPRVGRGYHLDRLTHSEPFLLPAARDILMDMASRFADAMEGTADEGASIRITSLTRTQSQQRKLRRRNANAFNGQSTHNYGASFDVAFIDRPNLDVGCGGPSWALQSILQDMQEKGQILVIPEGSCMHITPK